MSSEPTLQQLIAGLQRSGRGHGGIQALAAAKILEERMAELAAYRAEVDEKLCTRCKQVYRGRNLLNCPGCAMPLMSLLRGQLLASEAQVVTLRAKVRHLEEVIIALSGDAYEGITS